LKQISFNREQRFLNRKSGNFESREDDVSLAQDQGGFNVNIGNNYRWFTKGKTIQPLSNHFQPPF